MRTDYCADAPGPCSHHWQPFGTNVDRPGPLEFRGEDEAGMPTEERGIVNPCAEIEPPPLAHREDCGIHEGYMCTCRNLQPNNPAFEMSTGGWDVTEEFCGEYKGDHLFDEGSNTCRCGRAFKKAREQRPLIDVDALGSLGVL